MTEVLALNTLQGTAIGENTVIEFEKLIIIQYNLKCNLQTEEKDVI